jgi:hypothetical protein
VSIDFGQTNSTVLFIRPNALQPGRTYVFVYTAEVIGAQGLSANQNFTVRTINSPVLLLPKSPSLLAQRQSNRIQVALFDADSTTSSPDPASASYSWKIVDCPGKNPAGLSSDSSIGVYASVDTALLNKTAALDVAGNVTQASDGSACRFANGSIYELNMANSTVGSDSITLPAGLEAGEWEFEVTALQNNQTATLRHRITIDTALLETINTYISVRLYLSFECIGNRTATLT